MGHLELERERAEAIARRRREEPPRPQHPLLDLQRGAGNRATAQAVGAARLARVGAGATEAPAPEKGPKSNATTEIAILVIQAMQRGIPNPADGLREDYAITAHQVQMSLLRVIKAVNYWFDFGAVHKLPDGGFELVRPVPPLVIAGWVPNLFPVANTRGDPGRGGGALAPADHDWFPTPPDAIKPYLPRAGAPSGAPAPPDPVGQRLGPPRRVVAPENLRTADALRVASYMLAHRVEHQAYMTRGLTDPADQKLGIAISDHFLTHRRIYTDLEYGAAHTDPDGTMEWFRPVPPAAAAGLLGIGPPDNPELTGWELKP